jgi:hypothetical protein
MRLRGTAHGPRRLRGILAGALVVTALTAGGALPAVGSTDLTSAPAAPQAPSTDELPVSVSVTSMSPQVLLPGDDLTVTATLTNDGTTAIEQPRASVRIYRYRMSSAEQISSWAGSGTGSPIGDVAATVRLDAPLEPGASTTVVITVEADSIGLSRTADAWGPRGVTIDVGDGTRRVGVERTFLVWASDDEATSARIGIVAPVVGPADDPAARALAEQAAEASGDGAATDDATTGTTSGTTDDATDPLTAMTASGGRLSRLLQATADYPVVSWAVDPALVERAATGSRSAQSWLSALVDASDDHEILRLPWADPDLSAIAHAGRSDDPAAPDLLQIATGVTGSDETSALWDDAAPVLWSADPVPDDVTAALAASSGDGAPLITGAAAAETSGPATVSTSGGELTALVPDATLSALLGEPSSVQADMTPATAAQRVLAETAVLARSDDAASTTVLATMPRAWEPATALVQAQLAALSEAPWVDTTTVAEMLTGDAPRITLPDSERDGTELTPAWVDALSNSWNAATAFAGVVEDPDRLLAGLAGDLVSPLSVAWRADPDGRSIAVNNAIAESNQRQTGLSVLLNGQFTVISSSAQISVAVVNELDQDATVRVELRPQKGCLETARSSLVPVAANDETSVVLTLRATANCDVTVEVSLLSESNRVLATPVTFDARVAPTIENVGLVVVSVLLGLGLAFGIWRTVRRGQTARRGAKVANGAGADTSPDDRQDPA